MTKKKTLFFLHSVPAMDVFMRAIWVADCQERKDICFVLDSSTSVGPDNFGLMLDYVKALVQELSAGGQDHRFSLITYSTEVKTIFSFNRYSQAGQVLDAVTTTRSVAAHRSQHGLLFILFGVIGALSDKLYGDRQSVLCLNSEMSTCLMIIAKIITDYTFQ